MKVCWRRLPNMRMVTEALGSLYEGASFAKVILTVGFQFID